MPDHAISTRHDATCIGLVRVRGGSSGTTYILILPKMSEESRIPRCVHGSFTAGRASIKAPGMGTDTLRLYSILTTQQRIILQLIKLCSLLPVYPFAISL